VHDLSRLARFHHQTSIGSRALSDQIMVHG
jgi:hypothetical protein